MTSSPSTAAVDPQQFAGKVAVITGGGSGIGLEMHTASRPAAQRWP